MKTNHPYSRKVDKLKEKRNFSLRNLGKFSAIPLITAITGAVVSHYTNDNTLTVTSSLTSILSGSVLIKRAFFGVNRFGGINLMNYLGHAIADHNEATAYERFIKEDPTGEKAFELERREEENRRKKVKYYGI